MITNPTDRPPVEDGLRSDQTLRRMWEESIRLATRGRTLTAEANAAASDAASAEQVAATHRKTEQVARSVAERALAEALDLVDIVNEKRAAAGLRPLTAGEPYDPPADQPSPVHIADANLPPAAPDPYRAPAAAPAPAAQDGGDRG